MLITPASASPNWRFPDWRALAVEASENWTVVWGEDGGGLWSRRRESGAGWQAARLLAAEVDLFDLAVRRDGRGVGTWYEQQADGDYVVWALHFDAATGVVTQRQVGPEIADPLSDVSVGVTAGGRAGLTWLQYDSSGVYSLWASIYDPASGVWLTPARVEDGAEGVRASDDEGPIIGLDDEGNALAVWAQSDGTSIRLWTAHYYPGTGWTAPVIQDAEGGTNRRPFDFAMNGAGDAVVLWSNGGELQARHYEVPDTVSQ